jgi:hypothetical protein
LGYYWTTAVYLATTARRRDERLGFLIAPIPFFGYLARDFNVDGDITSMSFGGLFGRVFDTAI